MKKFNMRLLEPRDMPRLIELSSAQNERDGTCYPLPRIFGHKGMFDPDITLALAVERRGELAQGVYFQGRMVEMCLVGCDAEATAHVKREAEAVKFTLRNLGIKGIVTHIPIIRRQIAKPLIAAGFRPLGKEFETFFMDLEGCQ